MDYNFGHGFLTEPQLFFGTTLLVGRVTGISGNGSFRGLPFRSLQFSSITIPDHCRSGRSVQLSRTIFQTFAQRFFDNSNVATMLSLDYLSVCCFLNVSLATNVRFAVFPPLGIAFSLSISFSPIFIIWTENHPLNTDVLFYVYLQIKNVRRFGEWKIFITKLWQICSTMRLN